MTCLCSGMLAEYAKIVQISKLSFDDIQKHIDTSRLSFWSFWIHGLKDRVFDILCQKRVPFFGRFFYSF